MDHIRVLIESGFLFGSFLGGFLGARARRLQFLAENAHRLPRTPRGWFMYHRERNYQVAKRAGIVGVSYGAKVAVVCGVFAGVETAIDVARDNEDWISGGLSGLLTGALFASAARLPKTSTLRFLGLSTATGVTVGVSQDLYRYYEGESAKYPKPFERTWRKAPDLSQKQAEQTAQVAALR
ncbi:hypothetical protein HDU93_010106 [Gonapodya sp. JEL0774]|nr:hypothetical protein HDU93_010106 [Gonapodya sp. JEL0774]